MSWERELKRAGRSEIVGVGGFAAIAVGVQMFADPEVVAVFDRITLPMAIVIAALMVKDGLHFRIVHRHLIDWPRAKRRAPRRDSMDDINPLDTGAFRVADVWNDPDTEET